MYQFSNVVVALPPDPVPLPAAEALLTAELLSASTRSFTASPSADVVESILLQCDEWVGESWTADLILVGSRRASRVECTAVGPTARRLIRYSPVPVWCTRPGRIGLEQTVAVAVDPTSDNAQLLVDLGVEIASLLGAGLLLTHVVDSPELTVSQQQDAGSALQKLLGQTDHGRVAYGVRPDLRIGRVEDAILAAVDKFDVDLLIMGTGSHPLGDVGNICESVVPELRCSLLTIPKGWDR